MTRQLLPDPHNKCNSTLKTYQIDLFDKKLYIFMRFLVSETTQDS